MTIKNFSKKYENNIIRITDEQIIFKFENGYGASLIETDYSYGKEIAVLSSIEPLEICYPKEITKTPETFSFLATKEEVEEVLEKIKKLGVKK